MQVYEPTADKLLQFLKLEPADDDDEEGETVPAPRLRGRGRGSRGVTGRADVPRCRRRIDCAIDLIMLD